jgi:hypothetical protein
MQLTHWLLVEVALLLIGLTKSLLSKTGFDPPGRDKSSFRLSALVATFHRCAQSPMNGSLN